VASERGSRLASLHLLFGYRSPILINIAVFPGIIELYKNNNENNEEK
jgi:hypothetical protein